MRFWKFTSLLSAVGFSLMATAFVSVNHKIAIMQSSPYLQISCDWVDATSVPGRLAGNGVLIIAASTVLTFLGVVGSFFRGTPSPAPQIQGQPAKPNRWA